MASTYAELRSMSKAELIKAYDAQAKPVTISLDLYRQEIFRREQEEQTLSMLRYTKWISFMTLVMTLATIVNVIIAFL